RGDRSRRHGGAEAEAAGLREELSTTALGAAVARLALDPDDLRDELDDEALVAAVADDAARRLAAEALSVARLGAEEGERAVAFLHLVAELDLEVPPAHRAGLANPSHAPPVAQVRAVGQISGSRFNRGRETSGGRVLL